MASNNIMCVNTYNCIVMSRDACSSRYTFKRPIVLNRYHYILNETNSHSRVVRSNKTIWPVCEKSGILIRVI